MQKFHPILYSTPMVQAVLEDRKTKTRRLRGLEEMNKCPEKWLPYAGDFFIDKKGRLNQKFYKPGKYSSHAICPYGKIGDVLWVRETFNEVMVDMFYYKASDSKYCDHWKPSIFMPKAGCRIFLEITDIKVERLQDISGYDAVSEGVLSRLPDNGIAQSQFKDLWTCINGQDSWNANPWVWVISFKKINKPENFK